MNNYEIIMKEHYRTSRITIGILCALLAPLSILFGLIGAFQGVNPSNWWYSISNTYYSNAKSIMIGVLAITAFYLGTYKGYDWRDKLINKFSAVFAIGIVWFPCENYGGMIELPGNINAVIHSVCAISLFTLFGINCFFLFTLGDTTNKIKKTKNLIFRLCGATMALGVLFSVINNLLWKVPNGIFITEAICLTAYSVAWLTKSGIFFKEAK